MKTIENNKIKIFVKLEDVPKTNTRIDFVEQFLKGKFKTYLDEDGNELQCNKNQYRSVSELYYMTVTRFPKTSFNGFLKVIQKLIKKNKNIVLVYCTMINKVVLRYTDNSSAQYITKYSMDRYFDTKGTDEISLQKLQKIFTKNEKDY